MRFAALLFATVVCATAAETRIATLNLETVFSDAAFIAKASLPLQEQAKAANEKVNAVKKDIENAERELETLAKGTVQRMDVQEQLEVLKVRYDLVVKRSRAVLDRAEVGLLAQSYALIRKELEAWRLANGYSAILLATPPRIGARNLGELRQELATHVVLAQDPGLDITAAFVKHLNDTVADLPAPAEPSAVDLGTDEEDKTPAPVEKSGGTAQPKQADPKGKGAAVTP